MMSFPRSYITCLTFLSIFFGRDKGRTYCNKNNDRSLFFPKLVEKNANQEYVSPIYKIYIHQNNYLNEHMEIMSFYPT